MQKKTGHHSDYIIRIIYQVVIIVAESKLIENQVVEFFFFAALQLAVTGIFMFMSKLYKYKTAVAGKTSPANNGTSLHNDGGGDEVMQFLTVFASLYIYIYTYTYSQSA